MTVALRDMTEGDLEWMALAETQIFDRAAWSEALIRQDWRYGTARYRVAVADDELAGYAVYGFDGDVFHLMNLAVLPDWRGRGIAKLLMDDFIMEARGLGADGVWLEVAVDNDAARALYAAYGFETVRIRRKYYQPGDIDAQVMRKVLSAYTPDDAS